MNGRDLQRTLAGTPPKAKPPEAPKPTPPKLPTIKKKMISAPIQNSVMEAVERDLKTTVKEINVSAPISGNLIERLKASRTAAQAKIAKVAERHDVAVGKLNTAADRVDAEAQAVENEANAIISAFGNE